VARKRRQMKIEGSILMQKKLLAVAVAAALAAPVGAMAQSSVTISGALNLWYESVEAKGATLSAPRNTGPLSNAASFDIKRRDRIQDGAGSNIRFTVVEDLGGGMQAFGQVESAVFNNADTRNNTFNAGAATGGWANRNSGVGLRGQAWGEILLGIWDIHYTESYAVDSQILTGPSHSSSLALLNTFGTPGNMPSTLNPTIGGRLSNVIRYASPNWGGFMFNAAYSRPSDGLLDTSANSATGPDRPINGKKARVVNFSPKFVSGPIHVSWSYMQDKDETVGNQGAAVAANAGGTGGQLVAVNGAFLSCNSPATPQASFGINSCGAGTPALVGVPAGALGVTDTTGALRGSVNQITSNRFQAAYTFPFGLKIGGIYDRSEWKSESNLLVGGVQVASSKIKREVWVLPLSYTIGAHSAFFTYAKANKWKGNIGDVDIGDLVDKTGASFISVGYQFALSKRTNLHLNYSQVRNEDNAGYDFFSNSIGMANGNFGADPKTFSVGLRHTF